MKQISRRDLFRSFFVRQPDEAPPVAPPVRTTKEETPQLALILDRFCLAWQGSFCSVCSERCPVEGAITVEQGKPRVNPDSCTGCQICHDVCPAPKNAVFLVDRKPRPGMIDHSPEPTVPSQPPPGEAISTQEGPAPLPDLHQAELDEATVRQLFEDVREHTELMEVIPKHAASAFVPEIAAITLDEGLDLLLSDGVRALQLRYRHGDAVWWDTLMPTPHGTFRIVRIRHDFAVG